MSKDMLPRFSLYGFLKNQKYFEAFLLLAFLDRGLSYFLIGFLIAFNKIWMNILEIPSGLIADTYGRRRAMIASFTAYIVSFLIFAFAPSVWPLFVAMFFYAVGDAFRTGTHKAMIFDWLASEGKTGEKTKYYGYTRSWSQIGAAVSVLLAAAAVILTRDYRLIFLLSAVPYLINIVNFLGYPSWLDGKTALERREKHKEPNTGESMGFQLKKLGIDLVSILKDSLRNRKLRGLLLESAVHRGNATLTRDYIQPVVRQAVLAVPFLLAWESEAREALLVGLVYFVLYIFSSVASRRSQVFADRFGGYERASNVLWIADGVVFVAAAALLIAGRDMTAIAALAFVVIVQNTWRPIVMSRIDEVTDAAVGATVLSIDSQAGSLYMFFLAPLVGLAADHWGLWPIAVFGAVFSFGIAVLRPAGDRKGGAATGRS